MFAPYRSTNLNIFTVSRLNSEVKAVLDGSFPLLWVEGEISNLARPASGHIYFTLKDAHAQVRCAMFRMRRMKLRFQPENGMQVRVRAKVGLYENRGEYQLGIEHMETAGEGVLRRAFDELKQRLGTEGLFDPEHKQPLPSFPQRIGVITSPTGAAIHDLLTVLQRRFPAALVIVYPVPVQGEDAAGKITEMIRLADQRAECDLLVLTRGGGSLEDLMAFNNEAVARAIYEAHLPLVSAIGHEIDFTIADFVADQRAPTPSAAAELISPDRAALQKQSRQLHGRLLIGVNRQQDLLRTRLRHLQQRLCQQHPGTRLQQQQQLLDELARRLGQSRQVHQFQHQSRLNTLSAKLTTLTPAHQLQQFKTRQTALDQRLQRQMSNAIIQFQQRLKGVCQHLHTVSPLATLGRGYAIVQMYPSGEVVRDAMSVKPGTQIKARLAKGSVLCRVEKRESGE
ncbi:Exodeoxyribonuclease VII large subunit [hydrothermal vent metagenome]|uniref:Exodeoxyribonuclease VII large subunit n=1 Tax=hydrothermal vent metagenome TaxID=652676 RepID=A0A3B1BHC0_9ZZZZ